MLKISITLPNNAQIDLETADAAIIDKILDVVLLDITRNLTGPTAAVNGGAPAVVPAVETPAPAAAAPSVTPAVETPAPAAAAPPLSPAAETPPPAAPPAPAAPPVRSWETAAAETATPEKESDLSPWPTISPDNAANAADPDLELDPEDEDWPGYDDTDLDVEPAATTPTAALIANGATAPRPGMFAPSEQAFIDFCRDANPLGDMRRVVVAAEGASRYLGMSGVDAQGLGHLFNLAGWPQAHNFTQTLRNSARSKFRWLERVPGRAGYYAVTDLGRKTALGD